MMSIFIDLDNVVAGHPTAIKELLALRKDADRYRYLRTYGEFGCTRKDGYGGYELSTGDQLDAEVDAQMRRQK